MRPRQRLAAVVSHARAPAGLGGRQFDVIARALTDEPTFVEIEIRPPPQCKSSIDFKLCLWHSPSEADQPARVPREKTTVGFFDGMWLTTSNSACGGVF